MPTTTGEALHQGIRKEQLDFLNFLCENPDLPWVPHRCRARSTAPPP